MGKYLPTPGTFAEGLRLVFSFCAIVAGLAIGIGLIGLVAVLVWGNWGTAHYKQIIEILGWALIGGLALMGTVLVGMLLGGPAGRFKAGAGRTGVTIEAEGHTEVTVEKEKSDASTPQAS